MVVTPRLASILESIQYIWRLKRDRIKSHEYRCVFSCNEGVQIQLNGLVRFLC